MTKSALAALVMLGLLTPLAEPPPVPGPSESPEVARVEQHLAGRPKLELDPEERLALARTVVQEARAHRLEPSLVLAVIEVESRFDPEAVSSMGAVGLMQIVPRTGLAWARRLGIPWRGEETLTDPIANVRIGVAYLARLRDRFDSLPTALSAYNQGPTRVSRRLGAGQSVSPGYATRVMKAWAGRLSIAGS